MKLCILHSTLGLIDRGSEVTTSLLATHLAKRHAVLVLQSGPVAKNLSYRARRIYPLTTPPDSEPHHLWDKLLFRLGLNQASRQALAFTRAAFPTLRRFRPDIILATNGGGQVRLLRQHFPEARLVVVGHAGIGYDDHNNLRARPDLFLAVSPTAEAWATQHAPVGTRVSLLLNPFDPRAYGRARPLPHTNLPRPVTLVVGALTAYKNISRAITAIQAAGSSLLLVGDGELAPAISAQLSQFPGDFRWVKKVPPAQMPQYYRSADAFCFVPDHLEAFGRVYLEAMAAGLPIVATDDQIRRELIGTQGFFADPAQPESILAALNQALASPRLNYRRELQSYSVSTVVNNLEKELRELLQA